MLAQFRDPESFLRSIDQGPVAVDQWQHEKLALVMRKARVLFFVPGLAEAVRNALWGPAFERVSEAVEATLEGLRPGARVAVIPEGPYVLARV